MYIIWDVICHEKLSRVFFNPSWNPCLIKIKISSKCAFLLHMCSSISFVYAANFTSQFALVSTPVPYFSNQFLGPNVLSW